MLTAEALQARNDFEPFDLIEYDEAEPSSIRCAECHEEVDPTEADFCHYCDQLFCRACLPSTGKGDAHHHGISD